MLVAPASALALTAITGHYYASPRTMLWTRCGSHNGLCDLNVLHQKTIAAIAPPRGICCSTISRLVMGPRKFVLLQLLLLRIQLL